MILSKENIYPLCIIKNIKFDLTCKYNRRNGS